MRADGSRPVHLATGIVAKSPRSWSPDGARITFAAARDGNLDVYAVGADGSSLTRLSDAAAAVWVMSADGRE